MMPIPHRMNRITRAKILAGKKAKDRRELLQQIKEYEGLYTYLYILYYTGGEYLIQDGQILRHTTYGVVQG